MVLSVNSNVFALDTSSEYLHSFNANYGGMSYYIKNFAVYSHKLVAKKDGGVITIEGYGEVLQSSATQAPGMDLYIHMEQFGELSVDIPVFRGLVLNTRGTNRFSFKVVMGVGAACHSHVNNIYSEYQFASGEKDINAYAFSDILPVTTDQQNIWTFSLKYAIPEQGKYDIRIGRVVTEYLEPGQ